jgi:hypothetical protein
MRRCALVIFFLTTFLLNAGAWSFSYFRWSQIFSPWFHGSIINLHDGSVDIWISYGMSSSAWEFDQATPVEYMRKYYRENYNDCRFRFMGLAVQLPTSGPIADNQLGILFPLWLPTLESALALLWAILRKRRKDAMTARGFPLAAVQPTPKE